MANMRKLMESIGDDGWGLGESEWGMGDYRDEEDDRYDQDGNWVGDYEDDEDEFRPEDDRLGHNDPDRGNVEEGHDVRKMTNKLHQYMDEGLLDPRVVADAALSYLSEADVADLARTYELIWDEDEDEDDSSEFDGERYL